MRNWRWSLRRQDTANVALVDLIHQVEMPVCWYSLGPADHESHRFIGHFIAAIASSLRRRATRRAAVRSGSRRTLEQVVTTLVNELSASAPISFVLDDYHLAGDNPDVNLFVSLFAQQVDDHCHLVVASRTC